VTDQSNPEEQVAAAAAAQAQDSADPSQPVEPQPAADAAALQAELEQARQELAEAKEQALRMAAEAQNQRRRAERDVESAHKFALEKFAAALLPVVDNLERALDAAADADAAVKPLAEGVALTRKSFLDVLAKFNIEQIDPLGAPFDPTYHEAVTMVDNPNAEPNTVLQVMQKGYTLNGRLLRAAMVMVAKGGGKKIDATA
jgi:molecular chaperone GrpE